MTTLGLQLILSTTLAAAPPGCSWAHPGANPYRGDPVKVLADFHLPPATRDQLRRMMRQHRTTDVVTITRDDIAGANGQYGDLRQMHSGHGQVCHGAVDRSAWSPQRRERALVYCADDACVIVPTICNNVSLVTRRPEPVAAQDDSPIDIEPAAGPRPETPDTASTPSEGPLAFLPPGEPGAGAPGGPDLPPGAPGGDALPPGVGSGPGDVAPGGGAPGGDLPGGGLPGGDLPGGGFPGTGAPGGDGLPPVVGTGPGDGAPGGGAPGGDLPGGGLPGGDLPGGGAPGPGGPGGDLPCCGAPGGPPAPPPIASVPEAPTGWLMAAGALLLAGATGRRRRRD